MKKDKKEVAKPDTKKLSEDLTRMSDSPKGAGKPNTSDSELKRSKSKG
jgi:hypothetical protein